MRTLVAVLFLALLGCAEERHSEQTFDPPKRAIVEISQVEDSPVEGLEITANLDSDAIGAQEYWFNFRWRVPASSKVHLGFRWTSQDPAFISFHFGGTLSDGRFESELYRRMLTPGIEHTAEVRLVQFTRPDDPEREQKCPFVVTKCPVIATVRVDLRGF